MGDYLSEGLLDGKKKILFMQMLNYIMYFLYLTHQELNLICFIPYKAANGGNVAAQYNLGDMYFNGKILGRKDVELGTKYLKLAALNNHVQSIKILKDNKIDF
ncbi:hypothetical protein Glove_86g175 [Diversispora epigaea]|uniref:Uncharacterized protein n=1 Tax=Diversispora epigaea TaxID=1348612 RepID=A0A397J7K6_9GLOM|nr:hypothetical protein Glove_86g175 [Diversispora epigaea]